MNKDKTAYQELIKGICDSINYHIQNAPITQIENGIVISNGTVEGYKIKINNIEYDNILTLGEQELLTNETVLVVYPNGQVSNMFILGALK